MILVLPWAVGITDGIWALATLVALELSEVCEEKPTRSIKIIPPLTIVKLPMGCFASGMSLYLPPFYQIEEKFEERNALMELIHKNLSDWGELLEPLKKKFPEAMLRKIPELLELPEKINFEQLTKKLSKIEEGNSVWKKDSGIIISGPL